MGYTIWEIFPKVRDPTSQQFHAALLGRGFVEVRPSLVLAIIDQSMFCIPILCGIEEEVVSLQTPFDLFWEIVPIHLGLSKNVVPKSEGLSSLSKFPGSIPGLSAIRDAPVPDPEIETQQSMVFITWDIRHFKPH